jgi:clan AA aspartic protease (TIGR02281 family)
MTAHAECKIAQLAEWPVRYSNNRPLIEGKINGQPVTLLVDTGATSTFIWESAATSLGLPLGGVPRVRVFGAGGEARILDTTIWHLEIGAYKQTNVQLLVLRDKVPPNPVPYDRSTIALLLGSEFLANFSTEFDLEHGVIRLLRPQGCKADQLAYWSTNYSLADLQPVRAEYPEIRLDVLINGKHVAAVLDTGAPVSRLEASSAKRVGVKPITTAEADAGSAHGVAGREFSDWLGLAETVSIGDETIRNVRVRIASMFPQNTIHPTGVSDSIRDPPELLLGFDFLLAHRLLVLPKERAFVFTYNGRPPFQYVAPDPQETPEATKAE